MDLPVTFESTGLDPWSNISVSHVTQRPSDPAPDRFAHLHEACELVVFSRVSGSLATDIGTFELAGPCAVWLPPMAIHDFAIAGGEAGWTLVQYTLSGPRATGIETPVAAALSHSDVERLATLVSWLEDRSGDGQPAHAPAILELMRSIVLHAPSLPRGTASHDLGFHKLAPFLLHLEALPRPECSLGDAAALCSMSSSYFSRLFSRSMGVTFAQYMIEHRLKRAALALLTTRRPIKAISHENGFHQTAYFSSLFKKRYGMTPTGFREQNSRLPVGAPG